MPFHSVFCMGNKYSSFILLQYFLPWEVFSQSALLLCFLHSPVRAYGIFMFFVYLFSRLIDPGCPVKVTLVIIYAKADTLLAACHSIV